MNAFTLWGEIKADTASFESALRRADSAISTTEAHLSQLERKTRDYGNTSATVARSQDRIGESIKTTRTRVLDAANAFEAGNISQKRMASVLVQTDSNLQKYNSRIKDHSARLSDWRDRQGSLLTGLSRMSGLLAGAGITFGAMAYGVGRAAISVDNWENQLLAATGSTEKAAAKLKEINAVAQRSPGVMTATAISTYALLKPMQVAEPIINSLIQAFGRIKMSLPNADINQFAFNINQLFANFDKQDFKQAVENFPRFGELIKKSFDLKSAQDDMEGLIKELRKLKEEGKLTKESWLKGVADSINKDQSLGKLGDTIGTKLEKVMEQIKIKLAPLGATILDGLLSAANQATLGEKIERFFFEVGYQTERAALGLREILARVNMELQNNKVDPTTAAQNRANFEVNIAQMYANLADAHKRGIQTMENERMTALLSIINNSQAPQALRDDAKKSYDALVAATQTGTESAKNAISQSGDTLKKTLGDLSKNLQLSPELRALLGKEIGKIGDTAKAAIDKSKAQIDAGMKDLRATLEKLSKDLRLSPELRNSIEKELATLGQSVQQAIPKLTPPSIFLGESISDGIIRGIFDRQGPVKTGVVNVTSAATDGAESAATSGGRSIGINIAQGMITGMQSMWSSVRSAGAILGSQARGGTSDSVEEQSPSKVFFRIGINVGQGFVDGMKAMKEPVTKAASTMLDTAAVKKAIAEQVKELKKEIADANASIGAMTSGKTNDLQQQAFGASQIKSTLEELVKLRLELATNLDRPLVAGNESIREVDRLSFIKQKIDSLKDAFLEVKNTGQFKGEIEGLIDLFGNAEATNAIRKQADVLGLQVDQYKKLLTLISLRSPEQVLPGEGSGRSTDESGEGTGGLGGGITPDQLKEQYSAMLDIGVAALPAQRSWGTFWEMMQLQMDKWKQSLPSMKQAIGENLLSSIERIGDVFGSAISQWDGTAKGFFRSLAQGFRQLIQQIVSELVRLMVVKAVLSLIGSIAGGASGGGDSGGQFGWIGQGYDEGGAVRGPGTGTSDSILARLSNGEFVMSAKAVRAYGARFFENLNSGMSMNRMMPAFASGGMVGGSSSVTSNSSMVNHFHINVPGGTSAQTSDQIQRAVINALHKYQQRNK